MLALITNDDGINAEGLSCLASSMRSIADVWTVAPQYPRNATGRSITLHQPIRVTQVDTHCFMADGTPSDCVTLAINSLLPQKPDIVISGINRGPNLGDDISYSGTVAAAFEACIQGVPALAVSLACRKNCIYDPAAKFTAWFVELLLKKGLLPGIFLNINVPDTQGTSISSYKIAPQGRCIYDNTAARFTGPGGEMFFMIGGQEVAFESIPGSDSDAVLNSCVSITPIVTDLTDYAAFKRLNTIFSQVD